MLNLDTHILLFALSGNLNDSEHRLLSTHPWSISSIVLWEISKLHQKGRITIGLKHPAMRSAIKKLTIWPLLPEICHQSTQLDFQSDPADELIAATSLVHQVPLLTRDDKIRTSNIVPLATHL